MPRCKFQSEMFVKAFLQKKKNTEQMHPEVGVYLHLEDWNDDDAHPNYVEMSTRRTLRFILQVLNYVCIYMVSLYLTSFSSIQTQGRCPPFFPFHMVLTGGFLAWGPHTTGAIPRRQAEALQRALAVKEAQFGANHPSTLISMSNLALLLQQQGKLAEAGLRSLDGER